MPPITTRNGDPGCVAFDTTQITSAANRSNPKPGDPCHPLAAGMHPPAIAGTAVRRLTPRECERLQGFPDDYTLAEYRGKPAADGPRYKALGNSMAVPVMRWIGERIDYVERLARDAT
jgi:DNA (cytosine-5)-methyltransferase 1